MFAEEADEVENEEKDESDIERTEQKLRFDIDELEVSEKKERINKITVQEKTSQKEQLKESSTRKEEEKVKTQRKDEKSPIVPKKKRNSDMMDSLFKIKNQQHQSEDEEIVLNNDKTKKKESVSKISNGKETQGKLIFNQKPSVSKTKSDENKNLISRKLESTKKVKTEDPSKISNYFIKDLRKTFIN